MGGAVKNTYGVVIHYLQQCANWVHCKRRGSEKSTFLTKCLGSSNFLKRACSLGNPSQDPLNSIKSPIITNTPCKCTCLCNALVLHIVERSCLGYFGVFSVFSRDFVARQGQKVFMYRNGEHPGDHNHQDFPKSIAIQMGGVL